ncbi:MAG: neutral zinc metallopeptidase [Actinomycetota bacterium]|nr:neutral zinc metallopeptidase [Actinomycetota bacterium]
MPEGVSAPPASASDEELVRAVEQVWRRLFREAGLKYEPVKVRHFGDPGAKPCAPEEEGFAGLYCQDERAIYFSRERSGQWRYVVAHEVGHHVQELRGTFTAAEEEAGGGPLRFTDVHLREELQADCYSGVWAHAVGLPPPGEWYHDVAEGEPGTHAQRRRWLHRGLRTGRPADCDPFAVASP